MKAYLSESIKILESENIIVNSISKDGPVGMENNGSNQSNTQSNRGGTGRVQVTFL